MKIRHALAGITIGVSVIAVAPQLTSAHVPVISVTCQTGINVDLTKYSGTDHVTIWKDGNVIADTDFTTEYHFQRGFTRTESHTWRVKVSAGDEASPDVSGTVPACVEASTTTSSVATDVPPVPSTTTPCQEDEPCFDCATMGNQVCGTTTTTLEPAVPTTPTTAPEIACVLGPDGHYNFAGTDNPCQGPAPATTNALLIPPATPAASVPGSSLPVTGSTSGLLILGAAAVLGFGLVLTVGAALRRR